MFYDSVDPEKNTHTTKTGSGFTKYKGGPDRVYLIKQSLSDTTTSREPGVLLSPSRFQVSGLQSSRKSPYKPFFLPIFRLFNIINFGFSLIHMKPNPDVLERVFL